jgi:hypothetical protein
MRRQSLLRPMHASRADALRKIRIGRDQQGQAARTANVSQAACCPRTIGSAEMAIHNGSAARQALRGGERIGRALGIGEKEEGGQGRRARVSIEAARQAR